VGETGKVRLAHAEDGQACKLLAEPNKAAVGFVQVRWDYASASRASGTFATIAVAPGWRKHGIGRKLVTALAAEDGKLTTLRCTTANPAKCLRASSPAAGRNQQASSRSTCGNCRSAALAQLRPVRQRCNEGEQP